MANAINNTKSISVGSHVNLSAGYIAEQEDPSLQCVHHVFDYNMLYGFRVAPIGFTSTGKRSIDYSRSRWVDPDELVAVG